jgi:hypothetical protein
MKMDYQEVGWRAWTGFIWLRIGQVVGCCECGNEPSGSIKCGEFLDQLRTGQLLRNDSELKKKVFKV